MKIHLASADTEEIAWAAAAGFIDGVALSPALLARQVEPSERSALILEICKRSADPVSVSVSQVTREEIYAEGRDLARISDNIVVQVPFIEEALLASRRLIADGVRIGVTLVFTAAQAMLAAKLGAASVTTTLAGVADFGISGSAAISEMSLAFEEYAQECDLFVHEPISAADFSACVAAAADGVVLSTATLRSLLAHPLTDRALDRYLSELSRVPRSRG